MWLDRKAYDNLILDNAKLREESRVLNRSNDTLTNTLDWLRVRVTQLEIERAQMTFNYTGVKIPAPMITREAETNPMTQIPSFDDMGDDAAKAAGIDWNLDGTLKR